MFGIFKKKSEKEILLEKYNKLMKESHSLSTTNRTESDKKFADAQEILANVDRLEVEESK